jgi:hypothetical protein
VVFDQSKKNKKNVRNNQKKVTKKKQNFLEKINKYFVKKTKLSFKGGNNFFFKTKQKKKVSKLSVLKNGQFQFCPQKSIGFRTPPPGIKQVFQFLTETFSRNFH